jgi:coronin-1B/1C/6
MDCRSPFNDSLISSASDDGKVGIWKVPENFTLHTDAEEPADVAPVAKLSGHMRYYPAPHFDSYLIMS